MRGRHSLLDRPLEDSVGITELLNSRDVADDDIGLRFYLEVLGLHHLHYGIWDDSDPMTLDGLHLAQERYLDRLLSFMPEGVTSVLDVGCGAGESAAALKARGYDVEGLSPEAAHGERLRAKFDCTFHRTRFEDFRPSRRYDVVFMSESAQYVPLDRLMPSIQAAVEPGGCVILSDYFVLEKDGSYVTKSGHPLDAFREVVASSEFTVEREDDITDAVAPSLDLACRLLDERLFPAIRLGLMREARKRPFITRMLARWLRRRLRRFDRRMENLDSELFQRKKRYLIFRLRAPGPAVPPVRPAP